jgi:hypothetical protein
VEPDSSQRLISVTQERDLDEFLHTAQLAGTDFTAGAFALISLNTFFNTMRKKKEISKFFRRPPLPYKTHYQRFKRRKSF